MNDPLKQTLWDKNRGLMLRIDTRQRLTDTQKARLVGRTENSEQTWNWDASGTARARCKESKMLLSAPKSGARKLWGRIKIAFCVQWAVTPSYFEFLHLWAMCNSDMWDLRGENRMAIHMPRILPHIFFFTKCVYEAFSPGKRISF